VRVNDGKTQVTEGPAVGAGTELDGYYIYDATDLDAAVAVAAPIPGARVGGTVAVRGMGGRSRWPRSQRLKEECCSRTSSSLLTSNDRGASTPTCSGARYCARGSPRLWRSLTVGSSSTSAGHPPMTSRR